MSRATSRSLSKRALAALAEQARARGADPPPLPERVRDALAGDSFVGACPGCRTVSHVVAHHAGSA